MNDLVVAARAGVAEEHAVELHGSGSPPSARARSSPSAAAVIAAVTGGQVVGRRRRRADRLGHLALAVAAHPAHRHAQRLQAFERLAREGARQRVAADQHDVGVRGARIGEHGVERVDVAVDVVERQDAH